jgi:hypothetical protein
MIYVISSSRERENCVDPLPFLVLIETLVEDRMDGLFGRLQPQQPRWQT